MPHVLRHTCASRLAQNGVDIKRIQEFLGHRTLAMTMRYAHLAPKHLEVCAEALDEINKLHFGENIGRTSGVHIPETPNTALQAAGDQ